MLLPLLNLYLGQRPHLTRNATIASHGRVTNAGNVSTFEINMYGKHMNLGLTSSERQARALTDLRLGVPIVLSFDQNYLVVASETITAERLDLVQSLDGAYITVTDWRAETLKARIYDGDICRIAVPDDVNFYWARAMADPTLDLANPMKGPFQEIRDPHARPARQAVSLCKAAHLLPSAVLAPIPSGLDISDLTRLTEFDLKDAVVNRVAAARLPMAATSAGKLHIFRPDDGGEEHYAIEIGAPDRATPVLTRLHSACFTGDVLGSLKCDCGAQLNTALNTMGTKGAGVLLYLNQEGRGIGLANKMRAYALQDQGFDTVEANHRLGFQDDERDFEIGAKILKKLGFSSVTLMTNNPKKVERLRDCGIYVVDRVSLKVGKTQENTNYLATKAAKSGHDL